MIDQHKPAIIGVTESWCDSMITDAEISLAGYSLYRKDRPIGMGGGVLLYIHESLSVTPIHCLNNIGVEDSVWCLLSLCDSDSMLIGLVYRSPNSPNINNDKLLHLLQDLPNIQPHTHLLLMGDFNFPNIDWCNNSVFGSDGSLTSKFFDITQDLFLTQHTSQPTRHKPGQRSSVLDLIFTLDPDNVDNLIHLPPVGFSDHQCLIWSYVCYKGFYSDCNTGTKFDYRKGDYASMNEILSGKDWHTLLGSSCIEDNWSAFKILLSNLADRFIPKVKITWSRIGVPWWSNALSKAIKYKHRLYNRYLHTMSSQDFQIYAKQRNLVKSQIRSAQRNYEEQLINKFSTNPKAFYSYVKSKQKIKASIPHLKISDHITTSNNLETAEVLNSFFQSTFTHENTDEVPAFSSRSDVFYPILLLLKKWCLKNYLSLNHLSHQVQMEFILIPLRNVLIVYVGLYACCTTNHSNLVGYHKTGSVLILFQSSKRESNLKPPITGQ